MNREEDKKKIAKTARMLAYVMMSGHEYRMDVKPEFYLRVGDLLDPPTDGDYEVEIDEITQVGMAEVDQLRQKLAEAEAEIVRLQALVKY